MNLLIWILSRYFCGYRDWEVKTGISSLWMTKCACFPFWFMTYWKLNMGITSSFFPTDDTAMLWGVKFYNDLLMQAGPLGNVQSELLFRKDKSTFTFEKGWAFPRRIYFNGDNCVMPPPDSYPWLPNATSRTSTSLLTLIMVLLSALLLLNAHV